MQGNGPQGEPGKMSSSDPGVPDAAHSPWEFTARLCLCLYRGYRWWWKTQGIDSGGQTFYVLLSNVLSWDQESLPVQCSRSGSAELSLSALLHPGRLCHLVYLS